MPDRYICYRVRALAKGRSTRQSEAGYPHIMTVIQAGIRCRTEAMIIDVHGHYTTAPKALEDWRNRQIAGIKDPKARPEVSELKISDDELRESIVNNQLKKMQERGSDLTIFSPRASVMAHHIGDFEVSSTW